MCQCTLRLISMYELTLFFEVCVSVLSTSFKLVWIGRHMLKNHFAKCQVQLSLAIKTQILKYLKHIYMYFNPIFHESRKQSHFTESKPS